MRIGLLLAAALVRAFFAGTLPQDCAGEKNTEVRLLTDRTVYRPGATMHLKFLVTNREEAPLYLYRAGMSPCTGQMGFFFLLLVDENGKEANTSGCSGDISP